MKKKKHKFLWYRPPGWSNYLSSGEIQAREQAYLEWYRATKGKDYDGPRFRNRVPPDNGLLEVTLDKEGAL